MNNNRSDCFARIDDKTCNALTEKKCENCSFYKPKDQVPDYKKYLKLGKKELKKDKKD